MTRRSMKEQGEPCHFVKSSSPPSPFSTICHCYNRGRRQVRRRKQKKRKGPFKPAGLTVTYRRPRGENGPFFYIKCINYIVLENERISGMKIDTMETKGMKFSGEVGAPAAQWVPLCHKLLPPPTPPKLWSHASVFCCLCRRDQNRLQRDKGGSRSADVR